LRFRPNNIKSGIALSQRYLEREREVGIKGGIYSAVFLIRKYAAEWLDIDAQEIQIGKLRKVSIEYDNDVYESVMTDALENGSGFVEWIYDNWDMIISGLLNGDKGFPELLYGEKHSKNCSEACYQCLKSYRNMNYHSLFDWRLGIAYIRLLYEEEYNCGLDGNFEVPELRGWKNYVKNHLDTIVLRIPHRKFEHMTYGDLPSLKFEYNNKEYAIIVTHPFWDNNNKEGILAEACAEAKMSVSEVVCIDSFNLVRRPSWCYKYILDNVQSNDYSL
jgi:hypothetical protein